MNAIHASAVVAAIAIGAGAIDARQAATFHASGQAVTIDVSVHDGKRPVTGLGAADFALTDNGVAQHVDVFAIAEIPLDVTLVLDVSSSVDGVMLARLKAGVLDVARAMRPEERLRLLAVQHYLREIVPLRSASAPPGLDQLNADGATSLYDGLAAALMTSSPVAGRRQLTIAFTDGGDTASILGAPVAADIAGRAGSVIYAVVPVDHASDPPTKGRGLTADDPFAPFNLNAIHIPRDTNNALFPGEAALRADLTALSGG